MMFLSKIKHMQGNSKVVAKNAIYAFLIKGFALGISFFSTPLFIKYFNDSKVLGLWYTMLSMLTWFLAFDLGIGNGIRNHLVKAITVGDKIEAKKVISSGFVAVGSATMILSILGVIIILNADLNSVFNVQESVISPRVLRLSSLMIFSAIMLRFFLTTVSSIYYALQKSAVNNFLALCVSVLQLFYVLMFRFDNVETALLNIAFAYFIISNLPIVVAGVLVFYRELKECKPHPAYVYRSTINKIMGIGVLFFLCQIFYLIIVNSNEFFISHFWNLTDTMDYTFYYKITMLISMAVSLGLTPTWSMITKSLAEGNYQWIMKFFRLIKNAGICVAVFEIILIPFLQPIMNLWLGEGVLGVHYPTAIAFACFGTVFIYSSMLSTMVCGLAKMKLQTWCYGLGMILKVGIICVIAKYTDYWPWTVWINVAILLCYCVLEHISLSRYIHSLNKTNNKYS